MAKKYQKQFTQFLSEVKSLKDAEKAQYEISDEASNIILLSAFDTDPEVAKERLIKKIEKGINRRHLKKHGEKLCLVPSLLLPE